MDPHNPIQQFTSPNKPIRPKNLPRQTQPERTKRPITHHSPPNPPTTRAENVWTHPNDTPTIYHEPATPRT